MTILAGDWADLEGHVIRIRGREALIGLDTQPRPVWIDFDNLRRGIRLFPIETWKDKFAEALAREIMAKTLGRSGFGTDVDELEIRIRKMLDQYEKDWG